MKHDIGWYFTIINPLRRYKYNINFPFLEAETHMITKQIKILSFRKVTVVAPKKK